MLLYFLAKELAEIDICFKKSLQEIVPFQVEEHISSLRPHCFKSPCKIESFFDACSISFKYRAIFWQENTAA